MGRTSRFLRCRRGGVKGWIGSNTGLMIGGGPRGNAMTPIHRSWGMILEDFRWKTTKVRTSPPVLSRRRASLTFSRCAPSEPPHQAPTPTSEPKPIQAHTGHAQRHGRQRPPSLLPARDDGDPTPEPPDQLRHAFSGPDRLSSCRRFGHEG